MTVAELIALLQQYPPDVQVVGTWEGITEDIREVSYERIGATLDSPGRIVVVLNVDRP